MNPCNGKRMNILGGTRFHDQALKCSITVKNETKTRLKGILLIIRTTLLKVKGFSFLAALSSPETLCEKSRK